MIITSSQIRSSLLLCLVCVVACEEKKSLTSDAGPRGSHESLGSSAVRDDSEDEKVTPPANIAGAYLRCTVVKVDFDAVDADTIGCATYDEKSHSRIDIATLASRIAWSYDRSSLPADTAVSVSQVENEPLYGLDVYYTFSSRSMPIDRILDRFTIVMDVTDLNGRRTVYRNESFLDESIVVNGQNGADGADGVGADGAIGSAGTISLSP